MTNSNSTLYCANHPSVPTSLRCNNCEKPICVQCAVLTPIGYRCKECIRGQQKKFDTAEWYDYILAFGVGSAIAFAGSLVVRFFGFLFFLLFIVLARSPACWSPRPFAGLPGAAARSASSNWLQPPYSLAACP